MTTIIDTAEATPEAMLTAEEVATRLNLDARTVKRMATAGDIEGVKIGRRGQWRFDPAAVDALLAKKGPKRSSHELLWNAPGLVELRVRREQVRVDKAAALRDVETATANFYDLLEKALAEGKEAPPTPPTVQSINARFRFADEAIDRAESAWWAENAELMMAAVVAREEELRADAAELIEALEVDAAEAGELDQARSVIGRKTGRASSAYPVTLEQLIKAVRAGTTHWSARTDDER